MLRSETERIEPKGIDPYYNRHCARFWYFTNNENSLYIENDDRRHTLHKISTKHRQNFEYFKPIWEEIKDVEFLKNAFEYFATREYDEKNVMKSYTTQYKKEQKDANLPNGMSTVYVELDNGKGHESLVIIPAGKIEQKEFDLSD